MLSNKYRCQSGYHKGDGGYEGSHRKSTNATDRMSARTTIRQGNANSHQDSGENIDSVRIRNESYLIIWIHKLVYKDAEHKSEQEGISPQPMCLSFGEDTLQNTRYPHHSTHTPRKQECGGSYKHSSNKCLQIHSKKLWFTINGTQ